MCVPLLVVLFVSLAPGIARLLIFFVLGVVIASFGRRVGVRYAAN
jgi:hypothetical protein